MKALLKTIIADDESLARNLIKNFLTEYSEIECVAECTDGFDVLKKIQEVNPDIVFLDIQMPKLTGLEVLDLLENPPVIIFTTAYDQYALKAFELNAVDYLMKPFSKERFKKAIEKAKLSLVNKKDYESSLQKVKESSTPENQKIDRIVIKDGHKIQIIPCSDVVYLEAQDDYVMIYTQTHKYLKQQTMKRFEQSLPSDFVRTHRSYMVNVSHVDRIEHYDKESYKLVMKNKALIPVSRTGYAELKAVLNM